MISYEPFRIFAMRSGKKRSDFMAECGFSKTTWEKIRNDKNVGVDILEKICVTYGLKIEEVVRIES